MATTYKKRKGGVLIYTVCAMTAFAGVASLAVDLGHVHVTKTELQNAADASARAGAGMLLKGTTATLDETVKTAGLNQADMKAVKLDRNKDIQIGRWDTKSLTFTKTSTNPNAVRVLARRQGKDAVATPFAAILGRDTYNLDVESIAMLIPPIEVNENVRAQANPFLSGAKKGTIASPINPHNNPDYAGDVNNPKASPSAIKGIPIMEGVALNFDSIEGTSRHDPNLPYFNPDGQVGPNYKDIGHNNNTTNHEASKYPRMYNENGIADAWIPINALVGVFLDDSDPAMTPAPENLDFREDASRDFTELKPKLKQIFFIGDGMNSNGVKQNFVAPKGATRLFLATWDYYEWNNNAGYREVKIIRPRQIITVK